MQSWLPFLINLWLGLLIVIGIPIAIWRMRHGRAAAMTRDIEDRAKFYKRREKP